MKLSTDRIVSLIALVGGLPEKAILEITYTSVYGERWRVTSDKIVPQRLE